MSSDLAGMISASQDALIDAIDFSKLGRPTASYVTDRRTVRVPFLAPYYSTDSVTVMRANIGDAGWVDPATIHVSCLLHNDATDNDSVLRPLTTSVNGAFQRGRLLSGQVLEDINEYAKVSTLYHWLQPQAVLEETEKTGFPTQEVVGGGDASGKRLLALLKKGKKQTSISQTDFWPSPTK